MKKTRQEIAEWMVLVLLGTLVAMALTIGSAIGYAIWREALK